MTGRLSVRDRRLVLALAGATVVWRWLIAQRTPLPGIDACTDLWLAGRLAAGGFGDLVGTWSQPLWSLLLAPAVACGAGAFAAAQIAACVCGAATVLVVALAAERWRESAGVPAAVLAMLAAGPVVASGAGGATALHALLVALAALALVARHPVVALLAAAVVALAGADRVVAGTSFPRELRLGVGSLLPFAGAALLPPRPVAASVLWLALGIVAIAAASGPGFAALVPAWSPLLAVLGGVGLVRLSARWRELALCAAVAIECHGAWNEIEPRSAVAERVLGRYAARALRPGEVVASDLPRLLWAAGQDPRTAAAPATVVDAARAPATVFVVLGQPGPGRATLAASLAGEFARWDLPADLADLVADLDLSLLVRRRRS